MTLNDFLFAFIPLFVAIDIVGTLPIFIGLTEEFDKRERKKLIYQAIATAFVLATVFLVSGMVILDFMGITMNDFRIGGGLVLLILAIQELLFSGEDTRRKPSGSIGIVPLGIPLVMGPAALTTILVLVSSSGFLATILSMIANLLIALFVLYYSQKIVRIIGVSGTKAFAKVAALFLAAIAIMMIRVGIVDIIKNT
ncbi:MAG: MarC family protein [Ignavibacteria bacterium]|nr:MarC family protein [Ignavibacteria bacterium]